VTAYSPRALPNGIHLYSGALQLTDQFGRNLLSAFSTSVVIGNTTTTNLLYQFVGPVPVLAGAFQPTSGGNVPTNGLYLSGPNTLGFVTGSRLTGSCDNNGHWTFSAPNSVGGTLTVLTAAVNGGEGVRVVGTSSGAASSSYVSFTDSSQSLQGYVGKATGTSPDIIVGNSNNNVAAGIGLFTNGPFGGTYGTAYSFDQSGQQWDLGWRDQPQNIQNQNYTFQLSDRGKSVVRTGNASTLVWTIPQGVFPVGAVIELMLYPFSTMSVTDITPAGGVTLIWMPGANFGTRILASGGAQAQLYQIQPDIWIITGGFGIS
jgi:hypothetical protein